MASNSNTAQTRASSEAMCMAEIVVCRVSAADAAVEVLDTAAIGLDYLSNATYLVKLDLELVDLAQDFMEAGDLGVGVGDEVAGAIVLHGSGGLGLVGELRAEGVRSARRVANGGQGGTHMGPALLNAVQQTVKVGAQCLQAGWVEQQTALGRGLAGSARRGASMLGEGNLLMVAESLDLALGQAELAVGNGSGGGGHCAEPRTATALSSTHWPPRAMDAGKSRRAGGREGGRAEEEERSREGGARGRRLKVR